MDDEKKLYRIAIIGGTGKEGKGLAYRWAMAGHQVIIGSRNSEKANLAVDDLLSLLSENVKIKGMENSEAVVVSEIAVLTVPFSAHAAILQALKYSIGQKLLIDVAVPLNPPKVARVWMPPEGSAAQQAAAILGEGANVSSAFHNISYEHLLSGEEIECDVLVCGNSKENRQVTMDLVADAGMQAWDAGPLENSMVTEGLTSILIGLNIKYKVPSSGIRITGINNKS